MSSQSLVRVNQKLAHAKFLIDLAREQNSELSDLKRSSFIEAICFHFFCAYQHYLLEIAETYQLKIIQEIPNEQSLMALFETKNKFPAEAYELIQLRKDSASWLFQLCSAYEKFWQVNQPIQPSAESSEQDPSEKETGDHLIQFVNLDKLPEPTQITLELLEQWQSNFKSLVIRQRETSAEF